MKAMKQHIEWCVMNAVTSDNSENIARCVYYATKLECQENIPVRYFFDNKMMKYSLFLLFVLCFCLFRG